MSERVKASYVHSWIIGLKGLLSVGLGLFALTSSHSAMIAVSELFGFGIVLAGIAILLFTISNKPTKSSHWKYFVIEGVCDVVIGTALVLHPEVTSFLFTSILGVWVLFSGLFQLWFVLEHSDRVPHLGISTVNSILTIGLGIITLLSPTIASLEESWTIGVAAIILGIATVGVFYQFRKLKNGKFKKWDVPI